MDLSETIKNACAVAFIGVIAALFFLPSIIHALIGGLRAMGAN